jgi:predicted amidohydrolase YtcJ
MIENAGLELSRREFFKGAGAVSGMLAVGSIASCSSPVSQTVRKDAKADAIYHGGPILTMTKDGDRAEALAVMNGRIIAVGALAEVMARKGTDTKLIDLRGKTLMPGFFDPHSHVVLQSVKFSTANLDPKPIGEAGSIADIQRILRDWIEEKQIELGKWVIGWGYDDTGIEEQRHPNRDDLDAVSTEHPILLMHISSHLMTGNTRMLEEIGVTAETEDPEGGVIQRRPDGNEPNGVLEENAMLLVLKKLPMPTPERAMEMIEEGLRHYAEAGITTAQDCATFKGTWHMLAAMEQKGLLPIDVITWPMYKGVDDDAFNAIVAKRGAIGRLRLGGVKLVVDGSIQGYTAFLSQPYHVQPDSAEPIADKCDTEPAECIFVSAENEPVKDEPRSASGEGHRGYASMTQEQIESWIKRCDEHGIQMQVHTNGDGATDMLITAVKKIRAEKPRPDLRTTIIHAQTMRDDQLDFSAKHGLTPSFFPIHVNFWGDRHRDLFLGPKRAARINPARSALDRKIKITLHHDAPIAGIEMLSVVWSAVNRVTTGGKILGPEERITPFEALRAITADAAWQNFEEDRKGTLETGKLADMVVLSDDPLSVDPIAIKDIRVMQTIKEGQTVYLAKG